MKKIVEKVVKLSFDKVLREREKVVPTSKERQVRLKDMMSNVISSKHFYPIYVRS